MYIVIKLKFRQYPPIHTNYIISHCITLKQFMITMSDTVLRQKGNSEHEKY